MANKIQQAITDKMRALKNLVPVKPIDGNGAELFTQANPANVKFYSPQNIVLNNSTIPDSARVPIKVTSGSSEVAISAFGSDAQSDTSIKLMTFSTNSLFNGTSWDRQRNNNDGSLIASGARTTGTTTANQGNQNCRGVIIHINITSSPNGTDTVDFLVRAVDPVSGSNGNALVSLGATNAVGIYKIIVYPSGVETAIGGFIKRISAPLPRTWCLSTVHSASTSFTYSVGYQYIL